MENIFAPYNNRRYAACFQLLLNLQEIVVRLGQFGDTGVGIGFLAVDDAFRYINLQRRIPHLSVHLRRIVEQIKQIRRKLYDLACLGEHFRIAHFHQIRELTHSVLRLQPVQIGGR
ncbi:hypothetical protein D3C71_1655140 [compost metagenome]